MPGEFRPHSKISTPINQKFHDGKATVTPLRRRMKYGRLSSDSVFIYERLAIYFGAAIQQ